MRGLPLRSAILAVAALLFPALPVAAGAAEQYGLRSEDLEGIAEHPRSIGGTRLAVFFRDLGHDKVKVSFRSIGDVDVNKFAKQFGGGGHARAAGALIEGNLEIVRRKVVAAAQIADQSNLRTVRDQVERFKRRSLRFGEEADGAGRSDFEQTSPQVRPMRLQVAVPEAARDRRAGVP